MFKAEGSVIESQLEKGMAAKTLDMTFLQWQSADLYFALQSKVTQRAIHMKEY
jgi:hypothetical protein